METTIQSRMFPVWVAFCTAVTVAVASGIVVDDSVPVRVAAGVAGLVVGVALSFALAALPVILRGTERPAPSPAGARVWAPAPPPASEPAPEAPTVAAPPADDRRARLEAQLAAADPDGDVDGWIASSRSLVGELVPGASGYFAALGSRSFPDDRSRLEAHRARLQTIVRDFL